MGLRYIRGAGPIGEGEELGEFPNASVPSTVNTFQNPISFTGRIREG
jgi:hypothetical protein